jgi:hypothetical protein
MTSLPFGKHKGTPIDAVPRDYLEWLLKQDGTRPATREMIRQSFARRPGGQAQAPAARAPPVSIPVSRASTPCPACGAILYITLEESRTEGDDDVPF